MIVKTYTYRIYPTKTQANEILRQLDLCRWLYNTALEHRITAYKTTGKCLSFFTQQAELPFIKEQFPIFKTVYSKVLVDVMIRIDLSFKHFFRRLRQHQTPGFPRFKGKHAYNSIRYSQDGFKVIGNRVRLSKIGLIKVKFHRKLEGKIKTCLVKRVGDQWNVVFATAQDVEVHQKQISSSVGIDLGIETFAVLSDGDKIENPRYLRKSEEKLGNLQSKYSKHKSVGKKRLVSKLHRKVANQRADFLHKQSRSLVNKYDLIAYENLNIKEMSKRCKPNQNEDGSFAPNGQSRKSGLNKSIQDVGWGKFIEMIKYKAEHAGAYAIAVNPRNTSQICSGCGATVKKKLGQRTHSCPECGLSIHRDLNASLNILRLGADQRNSVSKTLIQYL